MNDHHLRDRLLRGLVIPAHPLALTQNRQLDERRQRALTRYYLAAGAGGLAVGVHTTQFPIHDPAVGLLEPVLTLAAEEVERSGCGDVVRIAGVIGGTRQAVSEAELAMRIGYDAGLLSLGGWRDTSIAGLLAHCRTVANTIPLFGFYLQPAVGGIELPYRFWREFFEIPQVVAVKVAAFDRYQTLDVLRGLAASGRTDIALYTGNDDSIVWDLLAPSPFPATPDIRQRFAGGLLGQWAIGTRAAVRLLEQCHDAQRSRQIPCELLELGQQLTDLNSAVFDAEHRFAGCLAGIQEMLTRDGLLLGNWCWDPDERLSEGQADRITAVRSQYPHLLDAEFIAANLAHWLTP